jgi:hypothetical protein
MSRYRSAALRRLRRRLRGRNGRLAGSAVAAGLVLAVIAGHAHAPASGAQMAAAAGGTLNCSQLETLWESAGGSASTAFTAAEIAEAESSGRASATNYNTNGTVDRGLWQVNSIWGALSTYDPMANARAAVQISHDGRDWTPWITYDIGAYAGKC